MTFTIEEAWASRYPDAQANLFRVMEPVPEKWINTAEADRWRKIETVLGVVTAALEEKRRDKVIGSALEAAPIVYLADNGLLEAFEDIDAAEVFRTSQATLSYEPAPARAFRLDGVNTVAVEFARAEGRKCQRSWRILPEVGSDPRYPDLSLRDAEAVAQWDAAHG
jgi:isoleucyl-tRNA synthetase